MRRQEYKYIQTGVCVRNKTQGVNTSSDFCQNDTTTFEVSGATKVISDTKSCDFSGITYLDILTGATQCFFDQNLSGDCFNGTVWSTKVVADDVVVSDLEFFTGTGLTSDVPTQGQFVASVNTSLINLQYDYTQSGTTFSIEKPYGVEDLRFDICVELDIAEDCLVTGTTCGCPVGYSANTSGEACVYIDSSGATLNGSLVTVISGDVNSAYGLGGTLFYSDISNEPFPITDISVATRDIQNSSGDTIPFQQQVQSALWGNGSTLTGRLNNIGVWGSGVGTDEWIGFSKCIEVPETKTYSIGLAADDKMRFRLNGEEIFSFEINSNPYSHQYWRVLELTLIEGINIIEMEGLNEGSAKTFGAEIYDTTIDVLSGYTSDAQLSAVTIFTTGDLIGGDFDLGETGGYSCSSGYALNTCTSGTPICTQIIYEIPDPCSWTGSCEEDCSFTACSSTFETIKSGDTGVYIIDEEENISFTFNFTGDTSDVNSSTNFKFEVYKYDRLSSSFRTPAVFKSEEVPYSQISGITEDELISQIPVNDLRIDGDYLIKGYFTYDACTEFASRLGIKIDTSNFKTGSEYGLYNADDDWYFIAISKANIPLLTAVSQTEAPTLGALRTYTLFPQVASGQTEYQIFDNYNGSIMVALNGLTLADGYDYMYTGDTLTLTGATYSGDVITIVDTVGDGDVSDLYNDVFSVDSPVVSGVTDGEGANQVYYNTDTGKYELFTSVTPTSDSDISVTINGVTLANNIDYYRSITNDKRIILEGIILEGDIINVYYIPGTNLIGGVDTAIISVGFTITTAPTANNGYFVLEVAEYGDTSFSGVLYSATTNYVPNQNSYALTVTLTNTQINDKFIYRVKNQKEYVSLSGDKIISIAYSEVVPIEIQTNVNNTY